MNIQCFSVRGSLSISRESLAPSSEVSTSEKTLECCQVGQVFYEQNDYDIEKLR